MYWLILVGTFMGIMIYDIHNYRNGADLLYKVLMVLVIITSAFGFMLGSDSPYYQHVFEDEIPVLTNFSIKSLGDVESSFNIGFTLLMSLCKTIIPSFYFFKLVFACIVNITIFSFFKKNADKLFMALLFFFFQSALYFNFEILRESLAISVFLWSIPFMQRKQWVKYLLFCLLALSFHISAILMFFVPFILRMKVGSMKSTIIVSSLVVVLIYLGSLFGESIKPVMLLFDSALDMNHAEFYLNSEKYGAQDTFSISIPLFLFDVVLPIIMLYVLSKKRSVKPYYPFILLLPILVVLSQIVGIFYRFSNFFMVFRVLFYVEVFDYLSFVFFNKFRKIVFVSVCLLYLLVIFKLNELSYNDFGNRSIDRYYPYASILQDANDPARLYQKQRAIRY